MQCRCVVEEARRERKHPICFACLPPPAPLEPLRPGDTPSPGHIVAAMSGGAPLPERTRTDGTYPDAPPDPVAAVVARTIVERAVEETARPFSSLLDDLPPIPPRAVAPRSRQFLFVEGGKHPPIVTLCGSTRFRRAFEAATYRLTLEGWAVFSVACWMSEKGRDGDSSSEKLTPRQKAELDQLHLDKIRMSKAIHVLNPGGYIGESTAKEIGFAFALGLPITFLDEAEGDRWLTSNAHAVGATMAKHLGAERETAKR